MTKFQQSRFYTKTIREEKSSGWDYQNVLIFDRQNGNTPIGEYRRNYPSHLPFATFKDENDQWYALYSSDYDHLKVMTLPDCQPWCEESDEDKGFCPTDIYIPEYLKISIEYTVPGREDIKGANYIIDVRSEAELRDEINHSRKLSEYRSHSLNFFKYAFIAGCYWGDDTSWKIQCVDLSQIKNKIIKRKTWDYTPLPDDMTLRSCIKIEDEDSFYAITQKFIGTESLKDE